MDALTRARHLTAETLVEALATTTDLPDVERKLTVEWSTRMTSSAGYATYLCGGRPAADLKFSAVILPHVPIAEIRQIALHELAHLVAYRRHRDGGHGRGWKRTMRSFGIRPARTHNYHAIPAVIDAAGFHAAQCTACGYTRGVTSRRAANWRRRPRYHCGGPEAVIRILTDHERAQWLAAQS